MRNLRCAITNLVVAVFVFMFFTTTAARADEGVKSGKIDLYQAYRNGGDDVVLMADESLAPSEYDLEITPSETRSFDNRVMSPDEFEGTRWGLIYSELFLGGITGGTLDAGREFRSRFYGGFGQASVRVFSHEVPDSVLIQAGFHVKTRGTIFESNSYKGSKVAGGGGFELAILDISDESPLMSLTARTTLVLDHEEGKSKDSPYELHFQDSLLFEAEILFEFYGFFIGTGDVYRTTGYDVVKQFESGWFHASQIRLDLRQRLDERRHETFDGPVTDNSRYEFQLIQYVYRGSQPQGEWAVGFLVGDTLSRAAGYKTLKHDKWVNTLQLGLHGRVQLSEHFFLYASTSWLTEIETSRDSWNFMLGVQAVAF